MAEVVTFGDCTLNDYGIVVGVQRNMPGVELTMEQIAGRDGDVFKSARLVQPDISVLLVLRNVDAAGIREVIRDLSAEVLGTEPKALSFSSDDGLYYMAVLTDFPEVQEMVNAGSIKLTFKPVTPYLYGDTKTVSMSGTKNIQVSGSYRTPIRAYGTATPANGYFGIRVDDGDYVHVAMSGAGAVDIDSENRTCSVLGNTKQPTLDSDWLEVDAGPHVVTFDNGSGSLTLEWTERWL